MTPTSNTLRPTDIGVDALTSHVASTAWRTTAPMIGELGSGPAVLTPQRVHRRHSVLIRRPARLRRLAERLPSLAADAARRRAAEIEQDSDRRADDGVTAASSVEQRRA